MKKLSFVIALSFALVLLFGGAAYANFGPHGGYATDTDSCAGCHRAHTSFSTVTWVDTADNQHSALLVSSASTILEFCYACHGDAAPGASTNVEAGVFDAGPTSGIGSPAGSYAYASASDFGAPLNGGGFRDAAYTVENSDTVIFGATTSMHDMDKGALTDPMWGAGVSAPAGTNNTCTTCHDVHGSSNYRLLKDTVNGNVVGGYVGPTGEVPNPLVVSAESNYPVGGWLKHDNGAVQMSTYLPNYTAAEYKYNGIAPALDPIGGASAFAGQHRSISTWCAACHEAYDDKGAAVGSTEFYDYGLYEQAAMSGTVVDGETQTDGAGAVIGNRARHRHLVNISLASGVGPTRALVQEVITSKVLPLEDGPDPGAGDWTTNDYMGCLTCHRAHGSASTMTGWAEARYITNASAVVTWMPEKLPQPTVSGVNPNFSSAILRTNNRGVCERCHNK